MSSKKVLAAQPARLVLRVDDQIGNKGSVSAVCTITSQPSQAMPQLTIIVDNAHTVENPYAKLLLLQCSNPVPTSR